MIPKENLDPEPDDRRNGLSLVRFSIPHEAKAVSHSVASCDHKLECRNCGYCN